LKVREYVELSRPINVVMSIIGVVIGAGLGGSINWYLVFLAIMAAGLFTAAGNALNDYIDRDLDKIAHPERPIPSGRLSPKEALKFSVTLFIISAVFASVLAFYKPLTLLIYVPALLLMILYEVKAQLKNFGPLGNVVIALLVGMTFSYGALASNPNILAFMLTLYAFLSNWSREIIKDIEDMKGDKFAGRKTLPMILGEDAAKKIGVVPILLAVLTSPLPFIWREMGLLPFLFIVFGDMVFAYSIYLAIRAEYGKSQRIMKWGMIIILLAYILECIF